MTCVYRLTTVHGSRFLSCQSWNQTIKAARQESSKVCSTCTNHRRILTMRMAKCVRCEQEQTNSLCAQPSSDSALHSSTSSHPLPSQSKATKKKKNAQFSHEFSQTYHTTFLLRELPVSSRIWPNHTTCSIIARHKEMNKKQTNKKQLLDAIQKLSGKKNTNLG